MYSQSNPGMILVFALFVVMGCSGGFNDSSPVNTSPEFPLFDSRLPVGVSGLSSDGTPIGGMGTLGLFSFHVDPESVSAEIVSLRKVTTQDVLEVVDITNFLTLHPCIDCVKLKSISLDENDNLVLKIGIKHPFPAGNPQAPISGQNRADLHVFNVEGIVVSNLGSIDFSQMNSKVSQLKLENADGYTGYLDEKLDEIFPTEATIHPYIMFFDDYSEGNYDDDYAMGFESVTDPPPSGKLVMPMGSDYDYQNYIFNMDEPFDFIFAVGCTYGISAEEKSLRFNPVYRVPQFNKKAASEIWVEITDNHLRHERVDSWAELTINILDVTHGIDIGNIIDWLRERSNVDSVTIEIPGVILNPLVIDGIECTGNGHSPATPRMCNVKIENDAGAVQGDYIGLVKVLDTYGTQLNEIPKLNGMDGINRVEPSSNPLSGLFMLEEFATYQTFMINVAPSSSCGPITSAAIISPECPIGPIVANQSIEFIFEASSANGGDPVEIFEIDYNYDGVTFNCNRRMENQTFRFFPYYNFPNSCEEDIPYTFHMAFKAIDSCDPPNELIFATCDVLVDECFEMKNIRLRDDAVPVDLAYLSGYFWDDALLILYDDGQIWKYYKDYYYQHNSAEYFFTADVNRSGKGKLCNNRIRSISIDTLSTIIASNADGIGPDGNLESWPAQVFNGETGSYLGYAPTPGTGGIVPDVFAFRCYFAPPDDLMGFLAHDDENDEDSLQIAGCTSTTCMWMKFEPETGLVGTTGFDKLYIPQVKGVETTEECYLWMLEDAPDYYCAAFSIDPVNPIYSFAGLYFGSGIRTEDDTGWYNAKDITSTSYCSSERFLVLDELMDGSGVVKVFYGDENGGRSVGHTDLPDEFSSTPIRMQSDFNNVFILHGDAINGYFLSVFDFDDFPY